MAVASDKISELPQVLLQHIQYYLSPKQAAQTTTLSKAWRNTWSYNRPNFDLGESIFFNENKIVKADYNYDYDDNKFLDLVHSTLQGYHDHKLRINEFKLELLELAAFGSRVSLLDKWIPIVIHMGVHTFHLIVNHIYGPSSTDYYNFPNAIFEAGSIVKLSLQGCRLDPDYDKAVMFKYLRILKLYQVYIDVKTFDNITSSCTLIEDMRLDLCEGLESIHLDNLRNLNEFHFRNSIRHPPTIEWGGVTCLKSISICGAANWFSNLDKLQVLRNLKDLSLTHVCLSEISFSVVSTHFPNLKSLRLHYCYGLEDIQISSHSIQHISLQDVSGMYLSMKVHIDAPNIVSFKYSRNTFPFDQLSFAKTNGKWKSGINLWLNNGDVSLWLSKLNEMLTGGLSQSEISLRLYKLGYDHFQQISKHNMLNFEPVEVEVLALPFYGVYMSSAVKCVIDGLFCVCRPKYIDLCWFGNEEGHESMINNEFADDVWKILIERDQSISDTTGNEEESLITRPIWQNDLNEVNLCVYNDDLHE